MKTKPKRVEHLETRQCDLCGCEGSHQVKRYGVERMDGFYVVLNTVKCLNCKSIRNERRMVVAR